MIHFKKKLQELFKKVSIKLFTILYGKIDGKISSLNNHNVEIKRINFGNNIHYKVHIIKGSRIYTNRIHDTAYILKNKILVGPSYQLRNNKNTDCENNIVLKQGTPRIKKKLKGKILSLLSGGGANSNYWHWIFDVLPKLHIASKIYDLDKIDYFLFPGLSENFQNESLDLIGIPLQKRISSENFRHIEAEEIIVPDHPYNFKNDPSYDSLNIPGWIIIYLKDLFKLNEIKKSFPKKFYIDRSDSKSNHRHLRKIINEDEIKKILIDNNFEIIILSNLRFDEQVTLFKKAEFIVGLHGAGFANLVFCEKSTKVIELKSKSSGDIVGNLSIKNNLNFDCISVNPKTIHTNVQLGDIDIPLDDLKKKLSIERN